MNRIVIALAGVLAASLPMSRLSATDFFQNRGGHSLSALFGMPSPLTSELSTETNGFHLSVNHVNMFAGGAYGNEFLLLDGERTELMLSSTHQISSRWGLGVKIPLIAHAGGFLDHSIEQWHDWFALPNGNRATRAQDQIEIVYTDPNGKTLRFDQHDQSLGDVAIELYGAATCPTCRNLKNTSVVRVGVKLPTGKAENLAGSGAADLYADLTSANTPVGNHWTLRSSLGLLYTGRSDLFSNQNQWVIYGFLGMNYLWSPSIDLIAQFDWHTAMFDSGLTELGEFSLRLTVGGAIRLAPEHYLELALQEDLTPDTSPDVGFFIRYRRAR